MLELQGFRLADCHREEEYGNPFPTNPRLWPGSRLCAVPVGRCTMIWVSAQGCHLYRYNNHVWEELLELRLSSPLRFFQFTMVYISIQRTHQPPHILNIIAVLVTEYEFWDELSCYTMCVVPWSPRWASSKDVDPMAIIPSTLGASRQQCSLAFVWH